MRAGAMWLSRGGSGSVRAALASWGSGGPVPPIAPSMGVRWSSTLALSDLTASARIASLVRQYAVYGHYKARVDPLELSSVRNEGALAQWVASLDPLQWGFTEADLDRPVELRVVPGLDGFLSERGLEGLGNPTLRQLVARLEEAYCGPVGYEYMHIEDRALCNAVRGAAETARAPAYSAAQRRRVLHRVARAELFERFVAAKFPAAKRFGVDGCEGAIVATKALSKAAALSHDVDSVVLGMSHRGRLNVLVNVLHKSLRQIVREFRGLTGFAREAWGRSGDVKYHLGVEFDHYDLDARKLLRMQVLPNPSHLEHVYPVVCGAARAQQWRWENDEGWATEFNNLQEKLRATHGDASGAPRLDTLDDRQLERSEPAESRQRVLPIVLHGDAALAGQGVVYEAQQMHRLKAYRTGGLVHVVINNQIGFTTLPHETCSGRYCTALARAAQAPVLHVNADEPEAVTRAAELAFRLRQRFACDVFLDVVGYRRFGHNELDVPGFTQPRMYERIAKEPSALTKYSQALIGDGVITSEEVEGVKKGVTDFYEQQYEDAMLDVEAGRVVATGHGQGGANRAREVPKKGAMGTERSTTPPVEPHIISGVPTPWERLESEAARNKDALTHTPLTGEEGLLELGEALFTLPAGLTPHKNVRRVFEQRLRALRAGRVDYGAAEALALAALARAGAHVRLTGQDSERGTFSHRHAVVHDQTTYHRWNIFEQKLHAGDISECNNAALCDIDVSNVPKLPFDASMIEVNNGLLSENAALGFEIGYAWTHPQNVALWEAQFGDFANGAQVMLDALVAAAETKWQRQSALVALLPHGHDGQGPEHSSARVERFLQLCDGRPHKERSPRHHNLQVLLPSTPATLFHALRRQTTRNFRKPLIVFTPKKLLKLKAATSSLAEIGPGTSLRPFIEDCGEGLPEGTVQDNASIERVIICSGQIYYDLIARRATLPNGHLFAIARLEQLAPFPLGMVTRDLARYPSARSVVWAQEEPWNAGAWAWTQPRLTEAMRRAQLRARGPVYAGRDALAAPSVGDLSLHQAEHAKLLEDAFDLDSVDSYST